MRIRDNNGNEGEIVDTHGGNGWLTIKWDNGQCCDYYAPLTQWGWELL